MGLLEYSSLMMEAVRTSKTSAYFRETTRQNATSEIRIRFVLVVKAGFYNIQADEVRTVCCSRNWGRYTHVSDPTVILPF